MTDHTSSETEAGMPTNESVSAPSWVARHELPLFFALTFVLSWLFWPFTLLNSDSSPLVPFGPLLAAVAVATLAGGRRQLLELLRQLTRWRVHTTWYVIALSAPFVLIGLAGAVTVLAGAPAPRVEVYADWAALPFTLLSTMLTIGLFEEPSCVASRSPGCSAPTAPCGPRS